MPLSPHLPQWLTLHGLIVVLGLLVYVLTTHSLLQRRSPTAAISWVLSIALVPYVGVPLYLMFGTRKLGHSRQPIARRPLPAGLEADAAWPRRLAAAMGQPAAETYWNLQVHADGAQALRALWGTIDTAQREIAVCTFILGRDAIGREFVERLARKARDGVRVRLLLDGVGRVMGGALGLNELKAAGVQVALYAPIVHVPFKSIANLRNHRKLLVADGARLWCGGRNIAAEYFAGDAGREAWRDLTFDLEGPLAAQGQDLFEHDWSVATGARHERRRAAHETAHPEAGPCAQLIASGPDQADDTIHNLLVTACFKARSRIVAATPYFVPGDALLMALSLAARRGVAVDIVLPARSNHRMADFVRHRALRDLAGVGARVWLAPYMLHAKAVVVDADLALAGSANLDSRSLFLNYEMMMAFYAQDDVRRFADFIEGHRAASRIYAARRPALLRDLSEGLLLWIAFQL